MKWKSFSLHLHHWLSEKLPDTHTHMHTYMGAYIMYVSIYARNGRNLPR